MIDIGGDKFVSAFQAPPQMNPALGLRAVRLALSRPELFLEQLRAIVRASAHGDLRVMIPMIASVHELREVRELMDEAIAQVDAKGQPRAKHIPLGAMIEVPSAAIMAHEMAVIAEFLSIGTNDLIQYALAVDRMSRDLAPLASPFDPSILRLIRSVIEAGQRRNRPVSVCGAMASDPLSAVTLIGMGLRELSMEASAIPEVREAISRVTLKETEAIVLDTLELSTAQEIEAAIAEVFAPRFSDLLETE
jgi:phosphotransferase system enzyme I (PtsI)